VTLTLAELYVRQGLIGRACEILGKLAEEGNEKARQRLRELPAAPERIAALEELLRRVQERRRGRG